MAVVEKLHCVLCGYDVRPQRIGLSADGSYDPEAAVQHDMGIRVDTIGGRGRLTVERKPVTIPAAIGLLAAIDAARARVVADLQAAGVEVE